MISLRRSRLDDHWRATYRRNYQISIKKIECADGEIFHGLNLKFKNGINAIVGKNGIGKSNFIRSIFNSFASENSNRNKFAQLLDGSFIDIELCINNATQNMRLNPNDESAGIDNILCLIFDPCILVHDIQKLFSSQENLDELIESYGFITLSEDEIKLVNFLTNITYSKVEIVNIEDTFEAFPILPFFKVEQGGACYDSRSMGLGELSLLYFFWLISHIKKFDIPCFLLVEEPESFLPPLIQDRFCDVLAMTASTQGTVILVSTHSEHILKKIPRSHIHIMRKTDGHIRFLSASSDFVQMRTLGLTSPKRGIILYEDHAAHLFIQSFIKASSLFVTDSFYYHKSGSEGDILIDLGRFPKKLNKFSIVGIFDGDSQGRFDEQLAGYNNYIFLPSEKAPEELLIDYLNSANVSDMAMHLGTTIEILSAATDVAAGTDHHDYLHELANIIQVSYDLLFSRLCDLWVEEISNQEKVIAFNAALESKFS